MTTRWVLVLRQVFALAGAVAVGSAGGCSSDSSPPENVGTSCANANECYPGLDAGVLSGAAQCLTKVTGGYCTHLCTTDADCCKVPGECKSTFKQVCAPFESTGMMMCFLSCEDADIKAQDATLASDASGFCAKYTGRPLGCRSTGGGSKNRKVCVP